MSYTIDDSGKLKIDIVSDNADYINNFPRFGLTFAFIDSFDKVKYFARGEKENYEDKHAYAHVGAFECPVSGMTEKYVVPQENGAHGGARRLSVISDSARISFESVKDFSFNVTEFDERNLPTHSADLIRSGKVFVNVDYRNSGVGSNSCGPKLNEKYSITEKHISWDIVLILE